MNAFLLFICKSNHRQKRSRLNKHQSRSNDDKFRRFSYRKFFVLINISYKVVRYLRQRNIIDKKFSLSHQVKKKVQWTFKNSRFYGILVSLHSAIITFFNPISKLNQFIPVDRIYTNCAKSSFAQCLFKDVFKRGFLNDKVATTQNNENTFLFFPVFFDF